MKYPIPSEIESQMSNWRNGLAKFPKEYIQFQKESAEKEIPTLLSKLGCHKVVTTYMENDGWFDGMEFLHVIVENLKTGVVSKVKFADNQEWYMHGCGWSLIS